VYEKEIKKEVVKRLLKKFPNGYVIPERSFSNKNGTIKSRIDVFMINSNKFIGYEIKSIKDDPKRLTSQIERYKNYFDKLIIITEPKHSTIVRSIISDFCGLIEVFKVGDLWEFVTVKKALENKFINIELLSNLLWKKEIISILKTNNKFFSLDLSKRALKSILMKEYKEEQIKEFIKSKLVLRASLEKI
jgi:hypothetical protein